MTKTWDLGKDSESERQHKLPASKDLGQSKQSLGAEIEVWGAKGKPSSRADLSLRARSVLFPKGLFLWSLRVSI